MTEVRVLCGFSRAMWRGVVSLAALGVAQLGLGCAGHGGAERPVASTRGNRVPSLPKRAKHWTESDPRFWVDKLSTPRGRPRAIEQLAQLFEDARTRSNGDLTTPEVKRLIELTVEPLTQTYVNHFAELAPEPRVALIKVLAAYHDRRTEPALHQAFVEFAQHPETSRAEMDVSWAARGTADLQLQSLAAPMFAAFVKLRVSTHHGLPANMGLSHALIDMPSQSWVDPLCALLQVEMTAPTGVDEERDARFRDQLFWQGTAAQLLGRIGDPRAVRPLLQVMLDPAKAELQPTALLALVKLGKPTVLAANRLLSGQDAELVAYNAKRVPPSAPSAAYVPVAALVLGTSGRRDAVPALIAAVGSAKDDSTRALLALELSKLPANDESKAAFRRAYESLALETELPSGSSALEQLTEAAGAFRDPAMVEWLLTRAELAHGNAEDVQGYRAGVTVAVLEIARLSQLPAVKRAIDRSGSELEKTVYRQTATLLEQCADRVACYLDAIQKSENQERRAQFVAIKAGYMIGVLGDEGARDQLIVGFDKLTNAAVRFVAAQTIDYLTPNGSPSVSSKLDAIIARKSHLVDLEKATRDAPLKLVTSRIQGRQ